MTVTGRIKKLFGIEKPKEGPKEEPKEEEVRTQLAYLLEAKIMFNWGWGIICEQLKFESQAISPQELHSTAATGVRFNDALQKFEESLKLLKAAKNEDSKIKKIVNEFFSLISKESTNIKDELANLIDLFNALIEKIQAICDSCKRNKEEGEKFAANWEKKGADWQNYDPAPLLRKFKTKQLNDAAALIPPKIDELIARIENILSLEGQLPEIKTKPGKKLAMTATLK